jgi:hypothetical protein
VRQFELESRRVLDTMTAFERLVNAAGMGTRFNTWIQNPLSSDAAAIEQAYNNLQTTLRSPAFLNTGVLTGGELGMLRNLLRDPTTLRGAMMTPEARTAQFDQIREMINTGINRQRASIGQPPIAAPSAPPPPPRRPEDLPPSPRDAPPAPAAPRPITPSVLPPGITAGSTLEGTSNGNPVYQTPDGRRLMVQP